MHKALRLHSDPQTTVVVPEYPSGPELVHGAGYRIRLSFSANELVYSAFPSHKERAISVFSQRLNTIRLAEGIEFWRTRPPSPQPASYSCPQVALAVLI